MGYAKIRMYISVHLQDPAKPENVSDKMDDISLFAFWCIGSKLVIFIRTDLISNYSIPLLKWTEVHQEQLIELIYLI